METLPHVRETLERLAGSYRILLLTKGDLFDQAPSDAPRFKQLAHLGELLGLLEQIGAAR